LTIFINPALSQYTNGQEKGRAGKAGRDSAGDKESEAAKGKPDAWNSRMRVRCMDGKSRVCRIPGRLKRSLWVREGDVLLIEPWELGGETKGDVIFKYKPIQVSFLKKKGYLKGLEEAEEF
jgi:initiation factor 1A